MRQARLKEPTLEESLAQDLTEASADYSLHTDFNTHPRRALPSNSSTSTDTTNATTTVITQQQQQLLLKQLKTEQLYNSTLQRQKATLLARTRFLPGGSYLSRMRKGSRLLSSLPLVEARGGRRVAVINAVEIGRAHV